MGAVIALRLGCQVARPKIPQITVLFVEGQGVFDTVAMNYNTATPWARRPRSGDEGSALRERSVIRGFVVVRKIF